MPFECMLYAPTNVTSAGGAPANMAESQRKSLRQLHGQGKAILHAFGKETRFSELSYTYPLKLLSPRLPSNGTHPVSIAYILSYGGGLVPGDRIDLEVEVGPGAALVLLTQVDASRSDPEGD